MKLHIPHTTGKLIAIWLFAFLALSLVIGRIVTQFPAISSDQADTPWGPRLYVGIPVLADLVLLLYFKLAKSNPVGSKAFKSLLVANLIAVVAWVVLTFIALWSLNHSGENVNIGY
jgi:lipid-A-disaccharide synthase-like uncharacterized protein